MPDAGANRSDREPDAAFMKDFVQRLNLHAENIAGLVGLRGGALTRMDFCLRTADFTGRFPPAPHVLLRQSRL